MKDYALALLSLLILSACSTIDLANDWPDNIPPRSYYVDYYKRDAKHQKIVSEQEYLIWIHRFYFGWELYRRGWLQATDELVATIYKLEAKNDAREKALLIGKLVSAEWAKESNHRVINTRHLSIWGNSLTESIIRGEQLKTLDEILTDVNDLLAGKLKPADIKIDRYYVVEAFPDNFE
jgi:hypothetical protein